MEWNGIPSLEMEWNGNRFSNFYHLYFTHTHRVVYPSKLSPKIVYIQFLLSEAAQNHRP